MNRPSLVVLDVGHGNSAVLLDTHGVVVIDAGKGGVLLDFLREAKITQVDVMLLSHADTDHIRNAPDLLLDNEITVKKICYNSDASKESQIWQDLKTAIRYARREKGLVAEPQLTTSQTGLDRGMVRIEVLFPPPEMASSGPGGSDADGNLLTSNSMSAVIRLSTEQGPMVLLAGDSEQGCLSHWAEEGIVPSARVLLFPHHGGRPGHDDAPAFAANLTEAVKPEVVIFSIHRSQYNLPRPEIIDAVRRRAPDARIICTQLSAQCVEMIPNGPRTHLHNHPAGGQRDNSCCAGTIVIDLTKGPPTLLPSATDHLTFIQTLDGDPLCMRRVGGGQHPDATGGSGS